MTIPRATSNLVLFDQYHDRGPTLSSCGARTITGYRELRLYPTAGSGQCVERGALARDTADSEQTRAQSLLAIGTCGDTPDVLVA